MVLHHVLLSFSIIPNYRNREELIYFYDVCYSVWSYLNTRSIIMVNNGTQRWWAIFVSSPVTILVGTRVLSPSASCMQSASIGTYTYPGNYVRCCEVPESYYFITLVRGEEERNKKKS